MEVRLNSLLLFLKAPPEKLAVTVSEGPSRMGETAIQKSSVREKKRKFPPV
ncbi:hypothetical protein KAM622c_55040 (plasmid) [Klebsiella quasipneumoniae subsp. quasipneumoniae]|nr:hypothetical protein KAM622c_55040 [Klebsiella quasipneumoniae subsp. quasipneumoniae]